MERLKNNGISLKRKRKGGKTARRTGVVGFTRARNGEEERRSPTRKIQGLQLKVGLTRRTPPRQENHRYTPAGGGQTGREKTSRGMKPHGKGGETGQQKHEPKKIVPMDQTKGLPQK